MRPSALVFLLAAIAFAPSLLAQGVPPRSADEVAWYRPPESDLPAGTEYRSFESPSMGLEVGYVLYLPPFAPADPLPVFYWIPDSNDPSASLVLVDAFSRAVSDGLLDPAALVVAPGIPATGYLDNPDTGIMGASVVTRELVTQVEGAAPVGGDRASRAIGGIGVGGGAAVGLTLRDPDMFGAFVSLGGALISASEIQDTFGVPVEVASAADPFALSIEVAPQLRATGSFLRVGSDDPWVAANRRFAAHLGHQNLTVDYQELPRVGNTLEQYLDAIGPDLFRFLTRSFD